MAGIAPEKETRPSPAAKTVDILYKKPENSD